MKFKHKEIVETTLKETSALLGLSDFDITFKVAKEEIKPENFATAALAEVSWDEYEQTFHIEFSPRCNDKSGEYMREVATHELVHGLLGYHRDLGKAGASPESYQLQEELFVNRITRALLRLRK